MPEGYTHVRTARAAAKKLHYRVKHPAAFAAGANGPDSLFCFEVWKSGKKRRMDLPALGRRMHEEDTGRFLMCLVRRVKTGPQVEYALGFLSHYTADCVVHPYVYALQQPGMPYAEKGGHGYFEIALDSTLHSEDTGDAAVPVEDASPQLVGEELADVTALLHDSLLEAYGLDAPAEYLADAFYDLWRLRRHFTVKNPLKYGAAWLIEPLFGERGVLTGHLSPRKLKEPLPDHWKDPATGEEKTGDIRALLERAEEQSGRCMAAALGFWMHRLDEASLAAALGSASYLTGAPTPQSAPELFLQKEGPAPAPDAEGAESAAPDAENTEGSKPAAAPPEESPENAALDAENAERSKPAAASGAESPESTAPPAAPVTPVALDAPGTPDTPDAPEKPNVSATPDAPAPPAEAPPAAPDTAQPQTVPPAETPNDDNDKGE